MFHKHSRLQCLGHRHCKVVFSLGEPPPPLSTKVDIDVTHMINATRPRGGGGGGGGGVWGGGGGDLGTSPSVFTYCN